MMAVFLWGFGFGESPQYSRSFGLYRTDYDYIFQETPAYLNDISVNHLYLAYWAPDWTVPVSFGDFMDGNLGGSANLISLGFVNSGKFKSAGGFTLSSDLTGRTNVEKSDSFFDTNQDISYSYSGFYDPTQVPDVWGVDLETYLMSPNPIENTGTSFANMPNFGELDYDTSLTQVSFAMPRFRVRFSANPMVRKETFSGEYQDNRTTSGNRKLSASLLLSFSDYTLDGFYALNRNIGFGGALSYYGNGYDERYFSSNFTDHSAGDTLYRALYRSRGDLSMVNYLKNLVDGTDLPEDYAENIAGIATNVPANLRVLSIAPYFYGDLSLLGFGFELEFALPVGFSVGDDVEVLDYLYTNSTRTWYTNATSENSAFYLMPALTLSKEIRFMVGAINFLVYPRWTTQFYFGSIRSKVASFSTDLSPLGGTDATINGDFSGKAFALGSTFNIPVGFEVSYKKLDFYFILNMAARLIDYQSWTGAYSDVTIRDSASRMDYNDYTASNGKFVAFPAFTTDFAWYMKTTIAKNLELLFWIQGLSNLDLRNNSDFFNKIMFSLTYTYSGPLFKLGWGAEETYPAE